MKFREESMIVLLIYSMRVQSEAIFKNKKRYKIYGLSISSSISSLGLDRNIIKLCSYYLYIRVRGRKITSGHSRAKDT